MIFTQNTKISESKNRKIDQNKGWSRPFGLKICEMIDFDVEKKWVISILSESNKKIQKKQKRTKMIKKTIWDYRQDEGPALGF